MVFHPHSHNLHPTLHYYLQTQIFPQIPHLMTVYLRIPVVCCLGLDYVCLSNSSSLALPTAYGWILLVCPFIEILSLALCVSLSRRRPAKTAIDGHARMARLPAKCMGNLSSTSLTMSHNNIRSVRVSWRTHQLPVERKFFPCHSVSQQ